MTDDVRLPLDVQKALDGLRAGRDAAQEIVRTHRLGSMPRQEAGRLIALVDDVALLLTGERSR